LQSVLLFLSLRYFLGLSVSEFTIGPSPIFYILSLGISWGLSAVLGYIFVITLEKSGEDISVRRFLSEAYRYGFTNITGHALQFINQRLSYFLLSRKALGVFSNASSVGESLWLVSGSMTTVQYGRVSNLSDKKQREDLTLLFLKLNLMLCSIGGLIMFFVPETFYVWVFGKDFFGIGSLLAVLIPGLIFFSGYLILGHHFSGCGEFKKNIYCIVTGLIITVLGIAIIYFSRAEFSIRAAALITSLSYLGNFCSALFIFSRDASLSLKQVLPRYSDFILFANQIRFPRKK
jgi:O-antigen/teichoic acid export membrane protein